MTCRRRGRRRGRSSTVRARELAGVDHRKERREGRRRRVGERKRGGRTHLLEPARFVPQCVKLREERDDEAGDEDVHGRLRGCDRLRWISSKSRRRSWVSTSQRTAFGGGKTHAVQYERDVDLLPDLAARLLVEKPRDQREEEADKEALRRGDNPNQSLLVDGRGGLRENEPSKGRGTVHRRIDAAR